MKAAIYCRVSTEDQEREGSSLDSQLEACLNKAKELGYEVSDDYILKEVWSGLTIERPRLTELREWIANKEIDAIVVYSTDRLSRDPLHLLLIADECEKAQVELIFVTEPLEHSPEGQLIAYIKGYASKLEALKIRERSIRGKRTRAEQGRLPCGNGRRLYGYDYIKGKGVGEGVRYINETEARVAQDVYKWFVEECLTINAITRRLRALDIPTPAGGKFWRRQTVYRMLSNPAYTGKTYCFTRTYVEPDKRRNPNAKTKKTKGVWRPREEWIELPKATPPIVTEELFEQVQRVLKRNKELSTRNAKRLYLLSGYLFCQHCSVRYSGFVKIRKHNGKRYEQRYYRCGNRHSIASPNRCDNKVLHAPTIEKAVWTHIEALLAKPELVLTELQNRQENSRKASHLERNLETIKARLKFKEEKERDRIHKAFYTTGNELKFKKDITALEEEIASLKEEEANLINRIKESKEFDLDVEGIKQACELVRNNLVSLDYASRRLALEALKIRVMVDSSDINIEGIIPVRHDAIVSPQS